MTGLVGFSLSRVPSIDSDSWILSVGGALIGFIAVLIGHLTRKMSQEIESKHKHDDRFSLLRIGVIAFCIAILGWLIAVFFSVKVGWIIAAFGVIIGCLVFLIFFSRTFSSRKS